MHMQFKIVFVFIIIFCAFVTDDYSVAQELSGFIATETRVFPQSPLYEQQAGSGLALMLKPELYIDWHNGRHSLLFVPFFRLDQHDDNRTHWDIRELFWLTYGDWWEIRIGIRH